MSNQKQIATAIIMFCQDNRETLPSAATVWSTLAIPAKVDTCLTQSAASQGQAYVYNNYLSSPDGTIGRAMQILTPGATGADTIWMTADGMHTASVASGILYATFAQVAYAPTDVTTPHAMSGSAQGVIASFLDGHVALGPGPSVSGTQLIYFQANSLAPTVLDANFANTSLNNLPLSGSYGFKNGLRAWLVYTNGTAVIYPGWATPGWVPYTAPVTGEYMGAMCDPVCSNGTNHWYNWPTSDPGTGNTSSMQFNGLGSAEEIYQAFNASQYSQGHTYTLSAYLTSEVNPGVASPYILAFYDGISGYGTGTLLASTPVGATVNAAGAWVQASVSYTASASENGRPIYIVIGAPSAFTGAFHITCVSITAV